MGLFREAWDMGWYVCASKCHSATCMDQSWGCGPVAGVFSQFEVYLVAFVRVSP